LKNRYDISKARRHRMQALKRHPGVDLDADTSLAAMVRRSCAQHAARAAFSQGGRTLSFTEFERHSAAFADWLRHASGLAAGDRVALMLPNLLQYPVALAGIWRAGMVVVNINPHYTARELRYQLADSGASAIVALDSKSALLREVSPATALRRVVLTCSADMTLPTQAVSGASAPAFAAQASPEGCVRWLDVMARAPSAPDAEVGRGDIALLQYTGGTTGISKAAVLTHGNLLANQSQGARCYGAMLRPGEETVTTVLPLYHIFGLGFNALLMLHFGAHNHLVANPRDLAEIKQALASGCTVLSGVNTLYASLLDAPALADLDLRGLKLSVAGGTATQPEMAARWMRRTGRPISDGYGLTEASPFVLSGLPEGPRERGMFPMPDTQIEVRDADGRALPAGAAGEIVVRGPQIMREYWGRPEETARVLDAQGWLRTGDIGRVDTQGAFTIVDRVKDMVLVSGFNVYPNEVEAVLSSHPDVAECAVVGMPDERTGEAVKAFVVPRRAPGVDAQALIQHCRAELAAYKVPKQIIFVDSLPKTPVGKVLRRELRD
jgi:long-chain acyl-CoA synthetase